MFGTFFLRKKLLELYQICYRTNNSRDMGRSETKNYVFRKEKKHTHKNWNFYFIPWESDHCPKGFFRGIWNVQYVFSCLRAWNLLFSVNWREREHTHTRIDLSPRKVSGVLFINACNAQFISTIHVCLCFKTNSVEIQIDSMAFEKRIKKRQQTTGTLFYYAFEQIFRIFYFQVYSEYRFVRLFEWQYSPGTQNK